MTNAHVAIIRSRGSWIEQSAVDQLNQTAQLPGIARAVGLPDLHAGRGIPIGAAFFAPRHIYPHLVGNDIGCGMALWQTQSPAKAFKLDRAVKKLGLMDGPWQGDTTARTLNAQLPKSLASPALGTIGGGNHFAEFQRIERVVDEDTFERHGFDRSRVFLLVHSGSRGLGEAILSGHMQQYGTMALEVGSAACAAYVARHDQAMAWARLNRDVIAERFLKALGLTGSLKLDIFHNSVTPHEGGWLHRKGAAPADKGLIVIPGSRGTMTYLVAPKAGNADTALYSLAHGAGRKWPRSQAKAKLGKSITQAALERTALGGRVICEDKALIFEEAPQAYKNIESVITDLQDANLITVVAILRPTLTYKTRRV